MRATISVKSDEQDLRKKMQTIRKCSFCRRFVAKNLTRCGTCRHAIITMEVPRGVRHYKHRRANIVIEKLPISSIVPSKRGGNRRSKLWAKILDDVNNLKENETLSVKNANANYARQLLRSQYGTKYTAMQRGKDFYIVRHAA